MVYRIDGNGGVTDVAYSDSEVIISNRPGYQDDPTKVVAYSRPDLGKGMAVPESVTIGQQISWFGGDISGKLTAVIEILDTLDSKNESTPSNAYNMLNGFSAFDVDQLEDQFGNIPRVKRDKTGKHLVHRLMIAKNKIGATRKIYGDAALRSYGVEIK